MRSINKVLVFIIVIACITGVTVLPAHGKSAEYGKVVLVVADKLSINDIMTYQPHTMLRLIEQGSLGLMSNRTAGRGTTEDGCLTIGAGQPLAGSGKEVMGFNTSEKYMGTDRDSGLAYQSFTGCSVGRHQVVVVNLPEIIAANFDNNQYLSIGNLGQSLGEAGVKSCVLGNSDTFLLYERNAAAIAMDNHGRVDLGNVGSQMNRKSQSGSADFETNYHAILDQFHRYLPEAGFTVIDLADLNRIDYTNSFTQLAYTRERGRIVSNMDQFLEKLTSSLDPDHDMVIVCSPSVSSGEKEVKSSFSPLIIWGKGYNNGLLTSAGTKRAMIASSMDLAPTILTFNNIEPDPDRFAGKVIEKKTLYATGLEKLEMVSSLNQQVSMTNRLRTPMVKGFVLVQILVLVLFLLSLYATKRLVPLTRYMVILVTTVPLMMLLICLVPNITEPVYVMLTVAGSFLLTAIMLRTFKRYSFGIFTAIAVLTMFCLNVDAFFDSTLLKASVLGYDPMAGARYYGIGNEYMGVILGCTILVAASLYQWIDRKWARIVSALIFIFELCVIGAPALGTNAGGAIAAAFGFLCSFLLLNDYRISWRMILSIGIAVLALITGLAVFDMNRSPELQTHIGRTANLIAAYGWNEAWQIIYRKLAMNWKLIQFTIWSRVFIGILLTIAIVLFNPRGIMKKVKDHYPCLINGFIGIVFAAFAALVFNDSGIVAAATTSIFLGFPLLFLILGLTFGSDNEKLVEPSRSQS